MKSLPQIGLVAMLALAPVWVVQAQSQTQSTQQVSGDKVDPKGVDDSHMVAATRSWVDLQISGTAAVGTAQPLPGEVADAVYMRYLRSFSQPIPAEFKRPSASSEAQSGSGSSGR